MNNNKDSNFFSRHPLENRKCKKQDAVILQDAKSVITHCQRGHINRDACKSHDGETCRAAVGGGGGGVDGAGRCSGYRWASSCYADVEECSGEATSGVTSASCTSARLILCGVAMRTSQCYDIQRKLQRYPTHANSPRGDVRGSL